MCYNVGKMKAMFQMCQKLICLAAVMFAMGGGAAEVSSDDAGRAVAAWLRDDPSLGCGLRGAVAETRTCVTSNGGKFHVAKLADGGFVVTSADTTQEPIVAFSDGDDLVESDDNPLWVMLNRDFDGRASAQAANSSISKLKMAAVSTEAELKWAKLLAAAGSADDERAKMKFLGKASVSDVRVAPLLQSKWNQGAVGGRKCYNYYTPSNYVCGCVATATAQIMRYFEWPKGSVAQYTDPYCMVGEDVDHYEYVSLTTIGGDYNWAEMPLDPKNVVLTEIQRMAIGKLTYDVGVACEMLYTPEGSGTYNFMIPFALTEVFGYGNALAYESLSNIPSETLRTALVSNLDAKLPVAVGISGNSGGHQIVGDGYGYSDGTFYVHFNMGWGGDQDAWYAPPNLSNASYSFSIVDSFSYNIFTNSAQKGCSICSGRVLTFDGKPVPGAEVTATRNGVAVQTTTTDSNGIYALILPTNGSGLINYEIVAKSAPLTARGSVSLKACVPNKTLEYGYYVQSKTGDVNNVCDNDLALPDIEDMSTSSTPVPVPYRWILEHYPSTKDCEAAAISNGANGRPVWQSYLLALDPVDPASDLRITSFEMANGVPVIGWNVTNANIKALGYDYAVKGRASLLGGAWEPLSPLHRFFRVFVEKTDK